MEILHSAKEPDSTGNYRIEFDFIFECEHGCTYEDARRERDRQYRLIPEK